MLENPDFKDQNVTMFIFFVTLHISVILFEDAYVRYFAIVFFILASIILCYVVRITYTRMMLRVKNNKISLTNGIFNLLVSFILSYVFFKFVMFIANIGYWFWWDDPFPLIPFIQDRNFLL